MDEAKLVDPQSGLRSIIVALPGHGYFAPAARSQDWYAQLTAERLVIERGQRKWTNPLRQRNEATDCRALAVAALHSRLLSGVDLNSWCEAFEKMLKPPEPQLAHAPVNGPPAAPTAPNVIRSRFVWG